MQLQIAEPVWTTWFEGLEKRLSSRQILGTWIDKEEQIWGSGSENCCCLGICFMKLLNAVMGFHIQFARSAIQHINILDVGRVDLTNSLNHHLDDCAAYQRLLKTGVELSTGVLSDYFNTASQLHVTVTKEWIEQQVLKFFISANISFRQANNEYFQELNHTNYRTRQSKEALSWRFLW